MANQIGQFFESEPDQEQAVKDIASHLKRFWDPRMRKAIIDYAVKGGDGLKPLVLQAVNHQLNL
jgi:formate dehydrogenase subunit delta